ncbi:hypothetical protein HanXRQr2_Chr11g0477091 [Helianthus annuus]|uniref:Uncharacterized protein n=1 Tax=Helianthus annuus TaxID=4232 RepID=A0A9K3HMG4_HELAN|nr:hypothetical protein HanXRQr2_Chr11g0477091 [Helianthus annuus]KAJ0874079.1 hypothetical protein HanPSC8_Chr11g0459891 [Helianthus annuus]
MYTSSEFNGIVGVELGAGTGLVGMLLARIAKTVFLMGIHAYTHSLSPPPLFFPVEVVIWVLKCAITSA